MDERKKAEFRMLFLIATPKLAQKATRLFSEGNVPMQYHFYAQGTASSDIIDRLGLGSIQKSVLVCMMPKIFADIMLHKLQKELHLGTPNTGVAFTIPLSGSSAGVMRLMQTLETNSGDGMPKLQTTLNRIGGETMDNEYAMILAFVDQGFSEEVMSAAKPAGATGGTVFHSRRVGSEEAMKFWGITIQEEREIVIILSKKQDKMAIMKAIGEKCGSHSEAHGIVVSVPVDGVAGMN